jgi:triacylglycerol lipase
MYFPNGFDRERAIELGELVDQAYTQFEAFLIGKPWKLPDSYTLIKEIIYLKPARENTLTISSYFDADLRSVRRTGGENSREVPIGFIAERKAIVFLIFRGTITDQEWIQNIRIALAPYLLQQYGKVHDGFLQIYSLLRAEIIAALDGMNPWSTLFIAGHSLGGALATLALPDIGACMSRKTIALYTYGSPRIGDNAFVTAFNRSYGEKSFRIENTSDMVGLIPPPSPIMGTVGGFFSHVDTPVSFTIQADDLVKNHDIHTYLSALRESKPKRGILQRLKSLFA